MAVKCLKCGSSEVVLTTKMDVDFHFDEDNYIVLITNVMDEVYWGVEYDEIEAVCKCHMCGAQFSYDEWRKSLKQKGEKRKE